MPEFKYSSHSVEYFTRVRTKRSIKDGMGGHIGRITNAVQQHKMYENKQKKELKSLKKQNNILYSISKKSGSRREIKNINNIRAKYSKKTSVSSSKDRDFDSSISSNSILNKHRRNAGCKEINKLYHVVTDNLNNYNNQVNESINSDPTFDNSSFNLSSVTSDPLPVVTVSLRGGKKHRENIVPGLMCLLDIRATDSMIKIRHTNNYERKMRSNRL